MPGVQKLGKETFEKKFFWELESVIQAKTYVKIVSKTSKQDCCDKDTPAYWNKSVSEISLNI